MFHVFTLLNYVNTCQVLYQLTGEKNSVKTAVQNQEGHQKYFRDLKLNLIFRCIKKQSSAKYHNYLHKVILIPMVIPIIRSTHLRNMLFNIILSNTVPVRYGITVP